MARPEPGDLKSAIEEALRDSGVSIDRIAVRIGANDEIHIAGAVSSAAEQAAIMEATAVLARRAQASCDLVISLIFEAAEDEVYEAGVESFPASDPPSWTLR